MTRDEAIEKILDLGVNDAIDDDRVFCGRVLDAIGFEESLPLWLNKVEYTHTDDAFLYVGRALLKVLCGTNDALPARALVEVRVS